MTHREWLVDNLMWRGLTRGEAAQFIAQLELRDDLQDGKVHLDKRPDEVGRGEVQLSGPPLKVQLTRAVNEELPLWLAEQAADHPGRARLKA